MANFVLVDIYVAGIVGILVSACLFWYSSKKYNYWKKRGVPYDKAYPIIGSFISSYKKNFEELEIERYNKLGRIYGYYEGSKPFISIGEPELLKQIFIKDFQYFPTRRLHETGDPIVDKMLTILRGEDWKRIRTIMSPTFSTGKIKRMMSIFEDCAKTLLRNFKSSSAEGKSVDVLKVYGAFTMDVIASSAFSTKIDSLNDPETDFVKHAKSAFRLKMSVKILLLLCVPSVLKILKIRPFPEEDMDFFKNITLEIIEERKKTGQKRNDFLQLLLDSADEVAKEEKLEDNNDDIVANYGDDSSNDSLPKSTSNKHLSMNELVAQCLVFFLAGYHTTSTTLGLTTYLLALNQDVQEELFKEMEEVLGETNGELTYEAIQKMKYLDNVISETLRMYPPLIRLERTAEAEYEMRDTGITITKGMVIRIPTLAMHRDPKLFPDPERFNPDRFTPEERAKQVPYSYLPFGAGPRNCVAMRFALVELKVCLVNVLCRYHVKKCPETKDPLEFSKTSGLIQPKSIHLRLDTRNVCPLQS